LCLTHFSFSSVVTRLRWGFLEGRSVLRNGAWGLRLLPVRFILGVDLGHAACYVLGAFELRGFYRLIHNIVPLSVDHTLIFWQLPIELRLSSRRHHGAYCGLFVSGLQLLGFSFVFAITRRRLTPLHRHGCGYVVARVHVTVLLYNYYHQN